MIAKFGLWKEIAEVVRSGHFEESEDEQIDIFDIKVCKFSLPYADWYTLKVAI